MARRGRHEDGFTIVEMVVTALIVTIGAAATFGLLGAATKNTQRAKGTQVALDRAQQELEELRGVPHDELALTSLPLAQTDPLDPGYRVSGSSFALSRTPIGDYAPVVVEGGALEIGGTVEGATVEPGPEPFVSGDVSGEIYRYVVWRDDEACGSQCPRSQDFKQIVVAVKLDKPANQPGERGYVEVQSDFIDPTDSAANDPPPGSEEEVTGQQFYLSDTPCAAGGTTTRQPIVADHLLHNTLGECNDGAQTGGAAGAPDALLLSSPPDPTPEDPSDPPLYDYSTDAYLEPLAAAGTDKGVQLRRDDSAGCPYEPTGDSAPQSQLHRWVTDPMSDEFVMTGTATLELYSRTINDAGHTATICVYLFVPAKNGSLGEDALFTDAEGGNPYWTYTPESATGFWPRFGWGTVRLSMSFGEAPFTVPAGKRLGVALSVERSNTPVDAISVIYDHPRFSSRLEVETSTPIEG